MHLQQFLTALLAFLVLALAAPSLSLPNLNCDSINTRNDLPPLTPENFNATEFLTFAGPIRATTLGPFFANLTDEASVNATLQSANISSGGGEDVSSLNELVALAPAECDFQCQCHLVCTLWIWVIPFYLYCSKCDTIIPGWMCLWPVARDVEQSPSLGEKEIADEV